MAEELKREAEAAEKNAEQTAKAAEQQAAGGAEEKPHSQAGAQAKGPHSSGSQQTAGGAEQKTANAGAAAKEQQTAGQEQSEEKGSAEKAKPDAKDKQIDELTDKYKRLFAEFDNFRKRSEAEKAGMFGDGERTVLAKILPVVDNFERAQQSVPEELKGSSYVEGMDKIYRSFLDILKELGVAPIEAAGKPFDANFHNAVMHVEDDGLGENLVVEEFQKGYLFKDKVLRHSMVKVAN